MIKLLRDVVLVVLAVAAGAVAVGLVVGSQGQTWTSQAQVIYTETVDNPLLNASGSSTTTDAGQALATQRQVILGDVVLRRAAATLELSRRTLADQTSVSELPDSNVLTIEVSGPSARAARQRTQAVADRYIEYVQNSSQLYYLDQAKALDPSIARLRNQLQTVPTRGVGPVQSALTDVLQQRVQLVAAAGAEQGRAGIIVAATTPISPSSTSRSTGAVLGAGAGLVLGLGLVLMVRRPT